ncbi:MAG TPA: hypothetical protein VIN58_24515 [Roseateles sp.]
MLTDPDPKTAWQILTVDWYGRGRRRVQITSGTALWFHPGLPGVPLRWLLIRHPAGEQAPQALLAHRHGRFVPSEHASA